MGWIRFAFYFKNSINKAVTLSHNIGLINVVINDNIKVKLFYK